MKIIRFLTKLNHEGVISKLMSKAQVFGTIALCLFWYGGRVYILCKYFHRTLLRASLCHQFHCVPFLNSKFHVVGVAGSVSIFAPLCKLKLVTTSSNQL